MRFTKYQGPSLFQFWKEESGASFAEYMLVAALVAVLCVTALLALSSGA